jgi:NAD(P)-dependent dehydrogenase (short-subunit alcohol dehydrogenase family)
MKAVVITGSTRGIGYGLADSFLGLGHAVTVSGRSMERVDEAVNKLCTQYDKERVLGYPCDVTHFEQVQALWNTVKDRFGKIDVWINNAGLANAQKEPLSIPTCLVRSMGR